MITTLGWLGPACLFAALSVGCGDNQPSAGNTACINYQGQGSVATIALSPFADKEAEVLAIEASGKIVAPKAVYEHIVSDLALIRGQNPSVQDIRAMVSWVPDELLMSFDAEGMSTVQAGTYTDWDCANTHYGFLEEEVNPWYILLHFDHLFNAPLLASEYAMLPHVDHAEPNGIFGDGNDVCASIENDTKYNYIFDAGSGDCPAGCISHQYWGFSTDGDPVIAHRARHVRQRPGQPARLAHRARRMHQMAVTADQLARSSGIAHAMPTPIESNPVAMESARRREAEPENR